MILWNYINFDTYIYIYIYKPMVMYIAIIFNANLRNAKYQ
jgi:hypothetical protein